VVSAGSYLLSAAAGVVLAISLSCSAFCIRDRLLGSWHGAPARLVEAILAIALLIWIVEILGTFSLFYAGLALAVAVALALLLAWFAPPATIRLRTSRPTAAGDPPSARAPQDLASGDALPAPPVPRLGILIAVGVIAVVVAQWGLTTKHALDGGIFNFDSLWYHMPFAVDMVQSHSTTAMHYTDTVFTNWFYPQNSELLHAVGIAITHRDTLSLFINFGWLALAFLAAWCIGRPYGRGHLTLVAAAVILDSHTLIVREPGAAKNDLAAAALLLGAIAILINLWAQRGISEPEGGEGRGGSLPLGWSLAAAGLAVGLAAGTKVTVLAMAAAMTVAVIALAPTARRRVALGWWFVPALLGGGFWYLRNLVFAGSPLPEIVHLGPIVLPHPERLQSARPSFAISHYATDPSVWRQYFAPGLHQAFGLLWPLVLGGAALGAALALFRGRDRVLRWIGAVALFGMLAYLFTPLSAAGAEGAPVAFAINVRYVEAALLAGIVLLPLMVGAKSERGQWILMGALLLVLAITDRLDAVLRDPARVFAWLLVALIVLAPAGLLLARHRGARRAPILAGVAAIAIAAIAIGYPLQRDYLRQRFHAGLPGMHLDAAYRWARNIDRARIGLAGTTAGFLQYGFFGTELSNRVIYLGAKGPHGAFNAIPTCGAFRAAVNSANLGFLVTSPFLNFIHTGRPISSPEAGWLRDEPAVTPILRSGPVTVWRVRGALDPSRCGPVNAPLRRIPNAPS
jgi:hypothetical protein